MHRLLLLAISLATMALVAACAGPDATTTPNNAGVGPSEIWTRQFGTNGSGAADGVAAADVGSIYVVGQVASTCLVRSTTAAPMRICARTTVEGRRCESGNSEPQASIAR
jgi:hypothetical protein